MPIETAIGAEPLVLTGEFLNVLGQMIILLF